MSGDADSEKSRTGIDVNDCAGDEPMVVVYDIDGWMMLFTCCKDLCFDAPHGVISIDCISARCFYNVPYTEDTSIISLSTTVYTGLTENHRI